MINFHTLLYLFLLLRIFPTTPATPPAYTPRDLILLNCGASTVLKDSSHRSWAGDERLSFSPANAAAISLASTASNLDPNVSLVPYQTARVFNYSFTYTFPISKGQKFLRLYFHPSIYSHYDTSQSVFSVSANSFTLLSNFSPFHYSQNSSQPSFVKEFVIGIKDDKETLVLIFSPEPYSFGFVNGIEIVSIPDEIYLRSIYEGIKYVEVNPQIFYLGNTSALEDLYRLNIGGGRVDIQDDSGMFRAWYPDDDYLIKSVGKTLQAADGLAWTNGTPPYAAPDVVYKTARMASSNTIILDWQFPVDSGFFYLLRLHFCEFRPGVTKPKQKIFSITLNNLAADKADIISWAGGPLIPTFKDYIVWAPNVGRRKQNLGMTMFSDSDSDSALLNGLEIFKLNDTNGSLAAANPELGVSSFMPPTASVMPKEEERSRGLSAIYAATGSVVGLLAVVGVSGFFIHRRLHKVKKPSNYSSDVAKSSWLPLSSASRSTASSSGTANLHPSQLCRNFSLAEIKAATSNLDRNSIIGKGGFGCVYRGIIDNGAATVAIKRLNPSSNQGAREFLTEIQMLSKLRHIHLVSLIGYCDEDGEMILVYDYMANGSLSDHLYNCGNPLLSWKQCLRISMDAAKGLHYLHTGAEHAIIHRDVKSTNILLDHNWVAKISDFGLSKMGESNDSFTHISTNVKGTFGYLDPKYLSTHQLTRKSDVYAFGVVLFELLSGRAAVDVRLDEEQHSLAEWARYCVREGEVDRLIEPKLVGKIAAACLDVFVGIAGRCIHIQPLERPTMADVVMGLELALALQETAEEGEEDDDGCEVVISMDDITHSEQESDTIVSENEG